MLSPAYACAGPLPDSLYELYLRSLIVSGNRVNIASFAVFSDLQTLDLSRNKLTGALPCIVAAWWILTASVLLLWFVSSVVPQRWRR